MNTRFTAAESARILIPGLAFTLLLELYFWAAVAPRFEVLWPPGAHVAAFLLVVLVAGLTMYARETPKRRRAFVENQPSVHLQSIARTLKGVEPLNDEDARRLYFYILNNHVPPAVHEKIFFFGAVYHVIIQVRRSSFWFGVIGAVTLALEIASGTHLAERSGLSVFVLLVWTVYALNVRYNKADRKMQENYRDQILWLDLNRPVVERILREQRRRSA